MAEETLPIARSTHELAVRFVGSFQQVIGRRGRQ